MAKKAQLDAVRPVLEATEKELDKIEGFLDGLDKIADKGTDAVEAGLEKVADVVPDALDSSVHASTKGGRKLIQFFRDPRHAAISVVLLAAAAGAGLGTAGYFLAVKRLKAKIQAEADLEVESAIAEMRRFYETKYKGGKFSTPASAVEELLPEEVQSTIKSYRGQKNESAEVKVEGPPVIHVAENLSDDDRAAVLRNAGYTDSQIAEVVGADQVNVEALREKMSRGTPVEVTETTSNIFVDGRSLEDFDYAAELDKRSPDEPYVISHDEFMDNENGFAHQSLTYYNGDDVLTDDQDIPIPDIEEIVDSQNLTKFGYGSRDKNVVYVRNEKMETEFEITLSQGLFSQEVAGFQHSAPLRRFRRGDDE